MYNSLKMIIGDLADNIEVYCLYPGESPNDYVESIKPRVKESDNEFIFMTDIKGGSVHTALMELCIYENVALFSGMNMNLVLDVVLSCPDKLDIENASQVVENAKNGITFINYDGLKCERNEDF